MSNSKVDRNVPKDPGNREIMVEKIIEETIVSKTTALCEDVIGLDKEKLALLEMVNHPFRWYPEGSTEKGILFFGLSGNGKTMLMNWIVPRVENITVFNVTLIDLESVYQGEAAKLMLQLFLEARKRRPSLVCFDHADGLFWEMKEDTSECRREMLRVFLEETGENADNNNIFLLGSTDKPWVMDEEVLSRFSKHMYVPQPNHLMRVTLFQSMLASADGLDSLEFHNFAKLTNGFRCSEIRKICDKARKEPRQEFFAADHFKQIGISEKGRPVFVPCTKDAVGATRMRFKDLKNVDEVGPLRQVKKEDVFKYVLAAKRSLDQSSLEEMESYAEEHDPSFHGHFSGCPNS